MKPITLFVAPLLLLAAGCGSDNGETSGPPPAKTPLAVDSSAPSATPSATPSASSATQNKTPMPSSDQHSVDPQKRKPANGDPVGVIDTDLGKIVVMFFPDKAPGHVANFEGLANQKFYDGTKFHRTMPGFMIQGGDPNTKTDDRSSWGQGGPGYSIKAEFNDIHHARGILSMARSQDPDSAGSQFFIMVADRGELDHKYTAFGKVLSGMDIADKIVALPSEQGSGAAQQPVTIKSIHIEKWPVK